MRLLIALLAFYLVNVAYSFFSEELYQTLYGDITSFKNLFPSKHNEESEDDSDDKETEPPQTVDDDIYPVDPGKIKEDQFHLNEYVQLNRKIKNVTRRYSEIWTEDTWDWNTDTFVGRFTKEQYKQDLMRTVIKQFLIHARFFVSRTIRQRRDVRHDKRFHLGYLFYKLRRMCDQQMKIVFAAQIMNASYREIHLMLRMYERMLQTEIDVQDTLDFVKKIYETPGPCDHVRTPPKPQWWVD